MLTNASRGRKGAGARAHTDTGPPSLHAPAFSAPLRLVQNLVPASLRAPLVSLCSGSFSRRGHECVRCFSGGACSSGAAPRSSTKWPAFWPLPFWWAAVCLFLAGRVRGSFRRGHDWCALLLRRRRVRLEPRLGHREGGPSLAASVLVGRCVPLSRRSRSGRRSHRSRLRMAHGGSLYLQGGWPVAWTRRACARASAAAASSPPPLRLVGVAAQGGSLSFEGAAVAWVRRAQTRAVTAAAHGSEWLTVALFIYGGAACRVGSAGMCARLRSRHFFATAASPRWCRGSGWLSLFGCCRMGSAGGCCRMGSAGRPAVAWARRARARAVAAAASPPWRRGLD